MSDDAAHLPLFSICPPPRCYHRTGELRTHVCGERARWKRPASSCFADEFFCDDHALPTDVAIVGEQVMRRVHLTIDVYLGATSISAPHAQAEALARLSDAVAAAGGLLDTQRVLSTIGRYPAQAAVDGQNGPRRVPV